MKGLTNKLNTFIKTYMHPSSIQIGLPFTNINHYNSLNNTKQR